MKAVLVDTLGPSSGFSLAEISTPAVGRGHVRVRVKASSVNPVDVKIRSGALAGLAPSAPRVLHGDVAGIVDGVGEGVTKWAPGDEVFGFVGGITQTQGVLSEWAVADERLLAPKPKGLSFEQAAALPLVAITAWEALVDKVRIVPGDRVLVHGGTGGVGHIALQLAKAQGARVAVTVGSEEKAAVARALGADDVIVYRNETVQDYVARLTGGRGFDLVFDTVGGEVLDHSLLAVRTSGSIVSISSHSTHDLSLLHQKGASLHLVFMLLPLLQGRGYEHHGDILERVGRLVEQGALRPLVDARTFPFSKVGEAHDFLASGAATGKVVVWNDLSSSSAATET